MWATLHLAGSKVKYDATRMRVKTPGLLVKSTNKRDNTVVKASKTQRTAKIESTSPDRILKLSVKQQEAGWSTSV